MGAEGTAGATVDVGALMTRLEGDRELLAELLELFECDRRGLMADAGRGVEESDAATVCRAAHTLKGAVANFCAPSAVAAALALETAARKGDLSVAPALLDRLRREIDDVARDLALLLTPARPPDFDS